MCSLARFTKIGLGHRVTERPLTLVKFSLFIMLIGVWIKYWHTGGTIFYYAGYEVNNVVNCKKFLEVLHKLKFWFYFFTFSYKNYWVSIFTNPDFSKKTSCSVYV